MGEGVVAPLFFFETDVHRFKRAVVAPIPLGSKDCIEQQGDCRIPREFGCPADRRCSRRRVATVIDDE
jgi:hypothetical protein